MFKYNPTSLSSTISNVDASNQREGQPEIQQRTINGHHQKIEPKTAQEIGQMPITGPL